MQLRERLINELSPHIGKRPIHEIILLARRCKVKKWLFDAYKNLVLKESRVDLLGLRNKGIDTNTIANLFFIREETRWDSKPKPVNRCEFCGLSLESDTTYCHNCGNNDININASSPNAEDSDVSNKINEIFASEFAGMVSIYIILLIRKMQLISGSTIPFLSSLTYTIDQ
jgi:hypothetical protein